MSRWERTVTAAIGALLMLGIWVRPTEGQTYSAQVQLLWNRLRAGTLSYGATTFTTTCSGAQRCITMTRPDSTGSGHFITGVVTNTGNTVFRVTPLGAVASTPDAPMPDMASGGLNYVYFGSGTFNSTNTANGGLFNMQATGAGSSSFNQRALIVNLLAGYTGSSNTEAIVAQNDTASSATVFGVRAIVNGATTGMSVPISGVAQAGTKRVGVWGATDGTQASTITTPTNTIGGAFSNGSNAADILDAFDGTTAVMRIQDNGNALFTGLNANTNTTFSFNTSGKGQFQIDANGNTNVLIGTTNNVPLIFKVNGTSYWTMDTSGNLTAVTNNTYDIGASGATSARTIYAGTSMISPLFRSSAAKVLVQGTGTGATQVATTQTTVPTCSTNCGTSPSVVGTDTDGVVTMGATGSPASGWVLTFNGTWAAAPSCTVQMALAGMANTKLPLTAVTTTTTMTVVTNGAAPGNSDKYAYHCLGTQ